SPPAASMIQAAGSLSRVTSSLLTSTPNRPFSPKGVCHIAATAAPATGRALVSMSAHPPLARRAEKARCETDRMHIVTLAGGIGGARLLPGRRATAPRHPTPLSGHT